jgi:hypothetical protein
MSTASSRIPYGVEGLLRPETDVARADFLVELRGFEPMAIAGVGIRQSREFHARADSRLRRKGATP